MNGWLRGHATAAVAVIGFVSAVLTIVAFAVPDLRNWLLTHAALAWILCLGLLIVVGLLLIRRDAINQRLLEAKKLNVDLEARLHPTARDKQQFADLIAAWGPRERLMAWLNFTFNARTWTRADATPFYEWVGAWEDRFFDDEEFQAAFEIFLGHVVALRNWMSLNAAVDNERSRGLTGDNLVYSVADGDEREGGWSAFNRLREEAMAHVQAIFELEPGLEKLGRRRGL